MSFFDPDDYYAPFIVGKTGYGTWHYYTRSLELNSRYGKGAQSMKRQMWEFRMHKDDVTFVTSYVADGTAEPLYRPEYGNVPEVGAVRKHGDFLEIERRSGQIITRWPLKPGTLEEYPHFTEVPFLLDGSRYILEFRMWWEH